MRILSKVVVFVKKYYWFPLGTVVFFLLLAPWVLTYHLAGKPEALEVEFHFVFIGCQVIGFVLMFWVWFKPRSVPAVGLFRIFSKSMFLVGTVLALRYPVLGGHMSTMLLWIKTVNTVVAAMFCIWLCRDLRTWLLDAHRSRKKTHLRLVSDDE